VQAGDERFKAELGWVVDLDMWDQAKQLVAQKLKGFNSQLSSVTGQEELRWSDLARWERQVRCAVLCCAVLCCAVLCCAVLCCAALRCAVLRCAALCCAALRCAVTIHTPVEFLGCLQEHVCHQSCQWKIIR